MKKTSLNEGGRGSKGNAHQYAATDENMALSLRSALSIERGCTELFLMGALRAPAHRLACVKKA
jgi:hypothetical protein